MKTGHSEVIQNIHLHERSDGLWEDASGKLFDLCGDKLYEQRAPGKWYWLRPEGYGVTFRNQNEKQSKAEAGW